MSLSKYKFDAKYKAARKFTDRKESRQVFWEAFESLISGIKPLQVVTYYGIGGIGKTKLLKHLKNLLVEKSNDEADQDHLTAIFLSLDAYEYTSPTGILLSIRNKLDIPCYLFDYAILKYWSEVGSSPLEIKNKGIHKDSIVWDFLDLLNSVTGSFMPFKLIKKAFDTVKDSIIRKSEEYREEIQRIDSLSEIEIAHRLPYYLGLALAKDMGEEGSKYVFFIDSLETLDQKIKPAAGVSQPDEWLRELIAASEGGLFILAGREYLKWTDYNPGWSKYLNQHILGYLADSDANYFLKSVPIKDASIRNAIIELARGLPLYLDLCVTIYLRLKERNNEVTAEDFQMAESEVIARFLNHLTEHEREVTRVTALIKYFDRNLFSALVKSFNIGFPTSRFDDFIDSSFVSEIDTTHQVYKVHDNVRAHIVHNAPQTLKKQVVQATLHHVAKKRSVQQCEYLASNLGQLVSLLVEYGGETQSDIEYLLDISMTLIDSGYWLEVDEIVSTHYQQLHTSERLKMYVALGLLKGICIRRTGALSEANELFNEMEPHFDMLGRHYTLAQFQQANVIRLLGRYKEAEIHYQKLVHRIKNKVQRQEIYSKIVRQWADLLFLQGKFINAKEILTELLRTSNENELQQAETIRILGHIYRFNFHTDEALNEYKKAKSIAERKNAVGLIGKLYTNLTETLSWVNPESAIRIGNKSLQFNDSLNANIEVGKTRAALAVAYAMEGKDLESADQYAQSAIQLQQSIGYRSGVLFGFSAATFISLAAEDREATARKFTQVQQLIEELKVYQFIQFPLLFCLSDFEQIHLLKEQVQWLNYSTTQTKCKKIQQQIMKA